MYHSNVIFLGTQIIGKVPVSEGVLMAVIIDQ